MPMKVQTKKLANGGIKIKIKNLNVVSMEIAELELEFRDANGNHTGDLIIQPSKLTWNKGRRFKTGKSIAWSELFKSLR
jgi:hypothetical protein